MNFKLILISIFSLSAMFAQCDEAGGNSGWMGDGWCDTSNNMEACGWDNGDCCPNDCVSNVDNGCPDAGGCYGGDGVYDYCGDCTICMDPNSADYEDCGGTGDGGTGDGGTGGGDPEGAPTNLNAMGDFGSIMISWSAPSGGGDGGTGGDPEGVGEACTDASGFPGVADCALNCVDEATALSWIGDGFCDGIDEQYGMNLDCPYFDNDGGDCGGGTGGDTGGDTGGGAPDGWTCDETYYADGWCDCGCAVYDIDCDDPSASLWENCDEGSTCAWGETECSELQSCEDQGLVTCWDGSCAASEGDCPEPLMPGDDCCEVLDFVDCSDPYFSNYVGTIIDCSTQYCMPAAELGDGACTDLTNAGYPGVGFNCEDLAFDNGDCEGVDPNECPAGFVDNCNPDFEGASACCSEAWIGDTYCDGEDQAYGCDLLCYDGEEADCSGGSQSNNSTPSRSTFEKENGLKSVLVELTKDQFQISERPVRDRKEVYSSERVKRSYNSISQHNNVNRDLLGYNVYRDGVMIAGDIATNMTMYNDYDVMSNTEYCYQVSAIYTEGESELTASSCASSLGEPDASLSFSGNAASGTLDIQLSSSVDVAGFQFIVTGGTVTGAGGGLADAAGFQISSSDDGVVLGFSFDGSTIPAGDGTLLSVDFDYEGIVDICMETVVLSDSDGNPISVGVGECMNTEITVIMGDVNGDLTINVLDILVVVNSIVGGLELTPNEFAAADMNVDGSANVVDIIAIVNIILGDGSAMGESINNGNVIVNSENITVKSNGSIAGFELDVNGDFTLDNSQLPSGWNLYHSETKVLAFTTDGKNLSDEIIVPFIGSINVNSGLITDLHSSVIYAEMNVIPDSYVVSSAYPNPFNPVTQFEYAIPEDVNVNIAVYDASGSKVADIRNGFQNAGSYSVSWDASSQPSGIYFVRFTAGDFITSEKVMLLK